jgi:hypothetical protein
LKKRTRPSKSLLPATSRSSRIPGILRVAANYLPRFTTRTVDGNLLYVDQESRRETSGP